ncbi:MAG: molybdate transport system permease protein [Verrucomicrobiota bacterium]|jgi:molybdate transport system permease protein
MPLTPELWQALWLTLWLAFDSTLILLAAGIPLALWLNGKRSRLAAVIEALVTMPIVLPPTVIGFYLLVIFAPQQPIGGFWLKITGDTLVFSFAGLVVGSVIYSLPFAVQPFQAAFKAVPRAYVDAARNLGATRWRIFWTIILPLARRGVGVGAMLSFAHTLGEFGVVLMLGGSIPGKTRVASIALYDEVQKLNYAQAHAYALVLLAISFALVFAMALLQRRGPDEH